MYKVPSTNSIQADDSTASLPPKEIKTSYGAEGGAGGSGNTVGMAAYTRSTHTHGLTYILLYYIIIYMRVCVCVCVCMYMYIYTYMDR